MDNLLIHPADKTLLEALRRDPPHALLLVGPSGMGKRTIAASWASALTPFVEYVEPDEKGTIGIDQVRALYQRTRSKTADRQVIVVDHAESMGIDAQNSFLKLLEEPRSGVSFILTAQSTDVLLPTITSRLQTVHIQPVGDDALKEWLGRQSAPLDALTTTQLLFVAQGRPGLAATLLADSELFEHRKGLMQKAKQLLGGGSYERLSLVNDLSRDRADLVAVLEAMAQMVKLHIAKSPEKQWLHLADGLQDCLTSLAQNGNPRAQLTKLFMLY